MIRAMKALISVTMAAQNCASRVAVLRAWRWRLFETCGFKRFLVCFLCLIGITSFHGGNYPHPLSQGAGFSVFDGLTHFPCESTTDPEKLRAKHNTLRLLLDCWLNSRILEPRRKVFCVSRAIVDLIAYLWFWFSWCTPDLCFLCLAPKYTSKLLTRA